MTRDLSILLPIDFSKHSLEALDFALALAPPGKASLTLLHVTDPADRKDEFRQSTSVAHLMNLLDHDDRLAGIPHTCVTRKGKVVPAVVRETARRRAGLVVMGTQGANTLTRRLFGTNTAGVIGRVACPVLAVPAGARFRPARRIVVATDLDSENLEMVNESIDLFRFMNPELMFYYAEPSNKIRSEATYKMSDVPEAITRQVDYPKTGFYLSTHKNLYAGLDGFCRKSKADWLLMVTHPRGFARSLFQPSRTKRMAFLGSIPLLSVPLV